MVSNRSFGSGTSRNSPANSVRTGFCFVLFFPILAEIEQKTRHHHAFLGPRIAHLCWSSALFSSLHVRQAWGLELGYFLQPLLPLISSSLSFGFVTCLEFPMFLTSIPVHYFCSSQTFDHRVSSCPAQ